MRWALPEPMLQTLSSGIFSPSTWALTSGSPERPPGLQFHARNYIIGLSCCEASGFLNEVFLHPQPTDAIEELLPPLVVLASRSIPFYSYTHSLLAPFL